jgi:4-amino-4-deoxy-L-arabinose transferase-like glycosyltransferase
MQTSSYNFRQRDAMEAVNQEQNIQETGTGGLKISLEFVAYVLLVTLALVLRIASLNIVPMTDVEAVQALPAYHALDPEAIGSPQAASSPVLFWLQLASFTAFGGNEFASRLPMALGGVILALMPLLFRAKFGGVKSFLLSLILVFSPIALTAARLADPVIWTMVFLLAFFWSVWRYWDSRSFNDALFAAGFLGAFLFLAESGAIILALILVMAGAGAITWQVARAPYESDTVGDEILAALRGFWKDFPVLRALLLILGLIVLLSTGFMLYPSGLNIVSELLNGTLRGFVQASIPDAPPVFALLSLFVYEPVLVIFAVIAALSLLSGRPTLLDRFAVLWALIAFVVLLVYQGSKPAYALWLVLPLAYLTASLISNLLTNYMPAMMSADGYISNNPNDYAWIKWVVALIVLAGFLMLSLNLSELGRAFRDYPGNTLVFDTQQHNVVMFGRMGWFIIMTMLLIVGFFLLASIWGNRNVLQGYGLGAFIFMLILGAGTGWNTSVNHISNPAELWHTTAVSPDAYKLRQTLYEVARRDSAGFPEIAVTVLLDEAAGITDDGLIAWLLRDFEQARFVETLGDAAQDEIILLPVMSEDPDLGGSYVGQSFAIRSYGTENQLSPFDWLSWFTQRSTRNYTSARDTGILWLRIDVYDGAPLEFRP